MDTKDLQGIDYLDTDSNTCLNFIGSMIWKCSDLRILNVGMY